MMYTWLVQAGTKRRNFVTNYSVQSVHRQKCQGLKAKLVQLSFGRANLNLAGNFFVCTGPSRGARRLAHCRIAHRRLAQRRKAHRLRRKAHT